MSGLDWFVLIGSTAIIVFYGIWKTRKNKNIDAYLLSGHSSHWWTIGLSVMATQASAITFLSTPGQAYADGLGFIQFYFGLPIAMIIICALFIPRYYNMKVFTVYEFLEKRFDLRTRLFTAILFLVQRGLGASLTIFAPAIILSSILGWNLQATIIIIGVVVTFYTALGGTKAVSATHKLQMAIMIGGIIVAFFMVLHYLPEGIGFTQALHIAGMNHKLNAVNFTFDWNNRYTFWSGITGGTFLALSYFGTDQSQAQRYISGHSIRDSRLGLIFNAMFKIPMQFIILITGVMVFVFYQFESSPVFFNTVGEERIMETGAAIQYTDLQKRLDAEQLARENIIAPYIRSGSKADIQLQLDASLEREKQIREEAKSLIKKHVPGVEANDRDYVFIRFILDFLPKGIIGLLISMILAAGMSSSSSEINALASCTTVDFYKRIIRKDASEQHYVTISKLMTVAWGFIAIGFASYGTLFENLIQFVNIIGSIFYGTILGIFLSAFLVKRITATSVFMAAIISQVIVLLFYWKSSLGFLWYNVIGCATVIFLGLIIEEISRLRTNASEV